MAGAQCARATMILAAPNHLVEWLFGNFPLCLYCQFLLQKSRYFHKSGRLD